jgi:hypothetical protein
MSFASSKRINHRNWNLKLGDQGISDPYFANVLLLFNGQHLVTTDSSSFNRSVAAVNGPTLSSVETLFGFPSYSFAASGAQMRLGVNGGDQFASTYWGSGEWCIEFFVFLPAIPAVNPMWLQNFGSLTVYNIQVNIDGSLNAQCTDINGGSFSTSSAANAFTPGVWHHVAFVRDNSQPGINGFLRLFLDGIQVSSVTGFLKTDTTFGSVAGFNAFMGYINSDHLTGYMTNYRLTGLHARYYSNFTPPNAPFPTS